MIAFGNKVSTVKMEIGWGDLTDKGQVDEVEKPLWDTLAKDWPAVVLFVTIPGSIRVNKSDDASRTS